jgi:hypothetical protein
MTSSGSTSLSDLLHFLHDRHDTDEVLNKYAIRLKQKLKAAVLPTSPTRS